MNTMPLDKNYLSLEDHVTEIDGLLTLIGEALEHVMGDSYGQNSAALGVQYLREGALRRLRIIASNEHGELLALRKRVKELEAAAAKIAGAPPDCSP